MQHVGAALCVLKTSEVLNAWPVLIVPFTVGSPFHKIPDVKGSSHQTAGDMGVKLMCLSAPSSIQIANTTPRPCDDVVRVHFDRSRPTPKQQMVVVALECWNISSSDLHKLAIILSQQFVSTL